MPLSSPALPSPPASGSAPGRAADPSAGQGARYTVALARTEAEVRAAQRLRHAVFADGMGARLASPEPGLDIDAFDAYCDHLLVREEHTGEVVGTYRLMPPERARVAGRLYAESEFRIDSLEPLRNDLVELGRSCVHPDHRDGAVIALMWAGIARYLSRTGHNWLTGCCSVPLADGGVLAARVRETVNARHLSPATQRVHPRLPWTPPAPAGDAAGGAAGGASSALRGLPPLLRGYLRLGARVCGEPAHDPEFGVADFLVLLSLRDINPRYLRHFLSLVPA